MLGHCWLALELKLFNLKYHLQKFIMMLSVLPPTTEKVMHVFLSSDLADFILLDFRLLDYL